MRDAIMKKAAPKRRTREMRAEYDFSGGVRGKYVDSYRRGTRRRSERYARGDE